MSERALGRQLTVFLDKTRKTVNIDVAEPDLVLLKQGGYALCFAKKVGTDNVTVVWRAFPEYLSHNVFSWTPLFQLFGALHFQADEPVGSTTNLVDIQPGQISILDSFGVLRPPTEYAQDSIAMDNQYGTIYPGLRQLSTGIDGTSLSTDMYLSPNPFLKGLIDLHPRELLYVWFDAKLRQGTVLSSTPPNGIEVDMTNEQEKTVIYSDQNWKSS